MRRLLPLAMIALTTSPALAEDPASRFVEAHRLAVLGAATKDPVLVFAAARLMQSLALRAAGPADWTATPSAPGARPADWQDGASLALGATYDAALGAGQVNGRIEVEFSDDRDPELRVGLGLSIPFGG